MRPFTSLLVLFALPALCEAQGGKGPAPLAWTTSLTLEMPDGDGSATVAVALSPDGKLAATVHADGSLRQWNGETGLPQKHLKAHKGEPRAVTFGPAGKAFLTACDKEIIRWDTGAAKAVARRAWDPGSSTAGMAVAPDLSAVAVLEASGRVAVWPTSMGEPRRWQAHPGVLAIAWSPDGGKLATAGTDGAVRIWDAASGKQLDAIEPRRKGMVRALAFAADGKALAAAQGRDGVTVWDMKTKKELQSISPPGQTWSAVALGQGGATLVAGSANGSVRLWAVAGKMSLANVKAHAGLVRSLVFAEAAPAAASVSADGVVKVWRGVRTDPREAKEPKLAAAELETIGRGLRGQDGSEALQAVQALAAAPRQALAYLREHIKPVKPADAKLVKKLIADLSSGTFTAREKATKALEALGDPAKPYLRESLKGSPSLEAERRVRAILGRLEVERGTPESRLVWRAVEALEKMATAEARQFLTELAAGVEDAFLTRAARAALRRLDE